jgi:hypothetical protein
MTLTKETRRAARGYGILQMLIRLKKFLAYPSLETYVELISSRASPSWCWAIDSQDCIGCPRPNSPDMPSHTCYLARMYTNEKASDTKIFWHKNQGLIVLHMAQFEIFTRAAKKLDKRMNG